MSHARSFAEAVGAPPPGLALDLGSGGGLPGLALALIWPASRWLLVDSRVRSTTFLTEAVSELGIETRVEVVQGRAETLGHQGRYRAQCALVVARGVGPPAVTAEYGAPFLEQGGRLVVSEPPQSAGERWSAPGLALLGLAPVGMRRHHQASFAVLVQAEMCPARYSRRAGVPAKRPLF